MVNLNMTKSVWNPNSRKNGSVDIGSQIRQVSKKKN